MSMSLKFKDFGAIHESMCYDTAPNLPHTVNGEKVKAVVRWFNYSEQKWVLFMPKMNAHGSLKHVFHNVKLLLLPSNSQNDKVFANALKQIAPWTCNTMGANKERYNSFEAVPTYTEHPYILARKGESVQCLGFGLYSTCHTKSKRYRITVERMVLVDTESDAVYNTQNVSYEGDYVQEDI